MADVTYVQVDKYFGDTPVIRDFTLGVAKGSLAVLVGPSGCGKSTLLRMTAGLEPISGGEIRIDGKPVNHLPPQARNVAMVFQNYALYPHMTVRDNLAFPLKMKKFNRDRISRKVAEAARMLGLSDLLDRKPGKLSGGQQQRVAMGRAIVRDPVVFLMDEPLSNLDARLRVEIRAEIARLQRRMETTMIYVTHDQAEALTLGDMVVVLEDGQIRQAADPRTLYDWPECAFVASFIGSPPMNLLQARVEMGDSVHVTIGDRSIPVPPERANRFPGLSDLEGREVLLGLRPEAFGPAENFPEKQQVFVRIQTTELLGHETLVYGELSATQGTSEDDAGSDIGQPVVLRLDPAYRAGPGERLRLGMDMAKAYFFHPETRIRL